MGSLSAIDPDAGDTHSFVVSDDRFEVVGNELKLKDGVSLNHEEADSIDVTVTATDAGGLATSEIFSITVADINETPFDIDFSGSSVDENNAGATVATLSASDPDAGDTATFSVADDSSGLFEVVGTELKLKDGVSLDHEGLDFYDVTVAVEDSAGNVYSEVVTINVTDVNEAPIDIELSGNILDENNAGAVVGTLSAIDPDAGDTHTFEVSDDRFEVVGNELKLKDGVSLNHEEADSIEVTVTATDAAGLSTSETLAITVADVNEGPTLGLASGEGLKASYYDIGHSIRNLSEIDFNATPDAEGVVDSLNYMTGNEVFWEGAPGNFFAAKYEGQLVVNEGGSYTINLASDDGSMLFIDGVPVLDNDGLHGTRTRSVTVDLDEGSHDIEIRYFENGGAQTLQLSWNGPDTGGANEIISGGAFEHGDTFDNLSVAEDMTGAMVATLAVADPDMGDTHTFTVDDDRFEVVEVDGEPVLKLKDNASLDHETETNVDVSVTVTDAAGASDTQIFSVDVDNSNSAPEISVTGGEGLQASYYNVGHSIRNLSEIDFNAAPDAEGVVDSLNYMTGNEAFWEGAPGDFFAAKYEGQLLVEEGGSYTINLASDDGSMLFIDGVAVLDNDGLHGTRTRSVTVDLDEGAHDIEVRYFENGGRQTLKLSWSGPDTDGVEQVIGGEAFRLPGVTDGDRVGVTENIDGDGAALLSIVDAEGDSIVYGVDDDRFEIVETDHGFALQLKSGETLDHEVESEVSVTITATDEHGESSTLDLSIPVADVNEAPVDIDFSNATVNENNVGATVAMLTVADPDAGDTHTFEVSDDRFEVVGNELKLKDGVSLDHEASETVDVTVTATDAAGLSTSETLEVVVADVNEAPVDIELSDTSVDENATGATVATLSASDPDSGDTATFSLADDASGLFEVVGNELRLKDGTSLNHEEQDSYEVTVAVEDGGGNVYSEAVTINVADVNEAPTEITLASALPKETVEASIVDAEITTGQGGGVDSALIDLAGADTDSAQIIVNFDYIDNSFEIDVNGESLTGGVIQLEHAHYNPAEESFLQFGDGAAITRPWVANTDGSPRIKVVITENGVEAFATRTPSSGVMEPLDLVNGSFSAPDLVDGENSVRVFNPDQGGPDGLNATISATYENGAVVTNENVEGVVIGEVATADPDAGDSHSYAVDDARFEVVDDGAGAMQLKLKDGVSLDHENNESVDVTVTSTDAGGLSTSRTFSVSVTDVNEAPVDIEVTGGDISENIVGATVATLNANDPDAGDTATFTLADDPSGLFEVVGNELKLKAGVSLDHEAQDSHEVTIAVEDSAGNIYTEAVTVNVNDINEAPTDLLLEPIETPGVLSLNQDGGNDDVAISSNLEGFPTDAITVEVTFASSQTDVGNGTPLFSYAANTGSNNEALIWLEGGSNNVSIFLAGQKISTGIPNASLLDGEQHTVSFTWDQASNELKVYVDGDEQFASTINIRDLRADGTVTLGQEQDTEGGRYDSRQIFEGEIAEVRIFDYARTGEEIADNAGAPLDDPSSEAGLVTNWMMNEEIGGVVEDLAGNNDLQLQNDASIEGGAAYETPTVVENEAGAVVGTLSANDPQTGGAVTDFSIADDPSGMFEIVGNELKLKDGVSANFEGQGSHEITVVATGADGETTEHTVTVSVANVDEAPVDLSLTPVSAGANALSLNQDGGNDDVAVSSNLEGFPTDAITVEVTFASSQTDVGNGTPLFSYAASTGSNNEALIWLEGGSGNVSIYLAGGRVATDIPNASLLDGEQHTVSFTWDQASNELKVYVDGDEEFSSNINIRDLREDGTVTFGQEQDAEGGRYDSRQIFEGEIAEVRIFDYARTGEEIADNAGAPLDDPSSEAGLVTNWVMNEETSGVVEDLAGNNDLQLQNGASIEGSETFGEPTVTENDAGAVVGTLSATDPNTDEAVTDFSIADDPSGMFEVVGNELKLKDGVSADYEGQTSYEVTVTATGSGGEATDHTFTVNIADIDEAPIVTDVDLGSSNEDASVVITEAQLLAGSADPEGAAVSVADLSVDPSFGAVADNGDGTWTFTPADGLSADDVEFTFTVSDGAQSTTGAATIDITAVADAPTLTIGAVQQIELGVSNTVSSGFEGGNVDTSAANSAWIGSIGDWRTTSDAIEIKTETLADGSINQFIELNDDRIDYYDDATNIFRVIDTQDGATYTVSFDHAARPGYNDSVNEFEVVINGDVIDTFSADGTGSGSINWLNDSISFVGDGSEMTVEFRASGVAQNYGRGMYLDDISITEDLPAGVVSGGDSGSIALPEISVASNDADGSETLSTAISDIPDGFLITDGVNTFTAGAGENEVDISDWAHDQLSVTPADGYSGEVSLTVTATSVDGADQAQAVETITIDVQSNDELLNGTDRIDILDGGVGNDTIDGGLGNDVMVGGDGSDVFVYAQGDGADVIDGGAGGWTDAILIEGGVSSLGEFGVDWTVELTEGAIISQDSDSVIFSEDSAGSISLNDGTTLEFENLEQII
ncbi:MAG: cadherin domain-containing protein [Pseudomonadota bacterium]